MEKKDFANMGTKNDMKKRARNPREDSGFLAARIAMVRAWIFKNGVAAEGERVKGTLLHKTSTTTTQVGWHLRPFCRLALIKYPQSAFSIRFGEFGKNVYDMFVPDLLHEFELGVWKATFAHLIRLLIAVGGSTVHELDERCELAAIQYIRNLIPCQQVRNDQNLRQGHDSAIQWECVRHEEAGRSRLRGPAHRKSLKPLAFPVAEVAVQCSIPAFEGLMPEPYNGVVLTMLFELCQWHAYAKLRLHSEGTLSKFEAATSSLGVAMRAFKRKVCARWVTRELPSETQSRQRRAAKVAAETGRDAGTTSVKQKIFSFITYKYHRLGDYVAAIREFGTMDNQTTQPVRTTTRELSVLEPS